MIRGCPCFPGEWRIQSGLRMESEVLILVSLRNLLRDDILAWRSANDIIMAAGIRGRISPGHMVQFVGIEPNSVQCKYGRVGQAWVDELHLKTTSWATCMFPLLCQRMTMRWIVLRTPRDLKVPVSTPAAEVEHASVSTMQEVLPAGAPAGGSDGSWIQAQSADLSGMTSCGVTLNDG
eukprot:2123484-Pyramimonas_sp.AAC.1